MPAPGLKRPQSQEPSSGAPALLSSLGGGLRTEVQAGQRGQALGGSTARCAPGVAWTAGARLGSLEPARSVACPHCCPIDSSVSHKPDGSAGGCSSKPGPLATRLLRVLELLGFL